MGRLHIGTFGATCRTDEGPAILIFHQYAHHPTGSTVHSSLQLEDNQSIVGDRPSITGGLQSIHTSSGQVIPLAFTNGHAQLPIRPFTDDEWSTLPHIHMTRNEPWDPSTYDSTPRDADAWQDSFHDELNLPRVFERSPHGSNYALLVRPAFSPEGTLIRYRVRHVSSPRRANHNRYGVQHADAFTHTHQLTFRHYVDDILASFDPSSMVDTTHGQLLRADDFLRQEHPTWNSLGPHASPEAQQPHL